MLKISFVFVYIVFDMGIAAFACFPHKLIVNGCFRTGFHTGTASYTFRMIGSFQDINIHFACLCTLLASDAFVILNLDAEE